MGNIYELVIRIFFKSKESMVTGGTVMDQASIFNLHYSQLD